MEILKVFDDKELRELLWRAEELRDGRYIRAIKAEMARRIREA